MTKGKIGVLSAAMLAAVVAFVIFAGFGNKGEPTSTAASAGVTNAAASGTVAAAQSVSPVATAEALSVRGTQAIRITSEETITEEVRRELADMGVRVIAPVGGRAVVAEVTPAVRRAVMAKKGVTVESVEAGAKVQPLLAQMCAKSDKTVPVAVIGLSAADRPALQAWVASQGGTVVQSPNAADVLCANVDPSLVASLSERADVRWIEYAPAPKFFNDLSAKEGASNVAGVRKTHKLHGKGQTVVVCDSGFDKGSTESCHADFAGRVKRVYNVGGYTAADYNGHGTHVSGTVLGDGTRSDGQYQGMAPKAGLVMLGCGDTYGSGRIYFGTWTYNKIFTAGLTLDAYIHSDSWGSDTKGAYTADCRDLDEVMWKNPELLVVVAAGNDGGSGHGTVGSPASAKNALTVGNAQSTRPSSSSWGLPADPENLNPTSSRGPTTDGRFKPDIAAPGTATYSTRSSKCSCPGIPGNSYYTEMTGTSMATPLVSGAAAVVREWLVERRAYAKNHGGKKPTGALLKAILTGGGDLMTGQGAYYGKSSSKYRLPQQLPNRDIGWGRINLGETLYPTDGRAVIFADRVPFANKSVWATNIVTTAKAPFDVQLAWIDYKGDPSAKQSLVNDLDLVVSNKTDGTVWYGNGIVGGDRTNTVESVRIETLPAGEYAVIVRGASVSYASTQGGAAAVYIRGAFPDETLPDPEYIRIAGKGTYDTLDEAFAAVSDGETIEVLAPVEMKKTARVPVSCTVVATNEDAAASMVTRLKDAAITVPAGVTLTVSNIVFSESSAALVKVEAGGQLVLREAADLGVTVGSVAIETADGNGLVLAAPLVRNVMLKTEAKNAGSVFGTYTCSDEIAEAEAVRISNFYDDTLELRGCAKEGALVWEVSQVPLEESAGYFVDKNGKTNMYARLDRVFERFAAAMKNGGLPKPAKLVVRKPGTLSYAMEVSAAMCLIGEEGAEVTLAPGASFTVVDGGDLTLADIAFKGGAERYDSDYGFIKVDGGNLTLDGGCVLDGIVGHRTRGSGVVDINKGKATMRQDAAIINCQAAGGSGGQGMGGAIYVLGSGCALNLEGGCISNCWAQTYGGGVYAAGWKDDAAICLSGKPFVSGNASGEGNKKRADDIYVEKAAAVKTFKLVGKLAEGSEVGIRYSGTAGNAAGDAFMANAAAGLDDVTLRSLVNDTDENLEAAADAAKGMLVWKKRVDNGQCTPAKAVVKSFDAKGNTGYYESVERAFKYMGEDSPYVVELQKGDSLSNSVTVLAGREVTLRLAAGLDSDANLLTRSADVGFVVPSGATLRLQGLCVSGDGDNAAYVADAGETRRESFFAVSGGRLEMKSGAVIRDVLGFSSRSANAVTVYGGGTFVMEDGAAIRNCRNLYDGGEPVSDYGVGGGLLVDGTGTKAYLKGGTIADCHAKRSGAVCVCNKAEVHVSGSMRVEADAAFHSNQLVVEAESKLFLDGATTGYFNMADAVNGVNADPNFIGYVAWKTGDAVALTNSASRFVHSVSGDRGTAAVNREDKSDVRLFWCGAVRRGSWYTNAQNQVFVPVAWVDVVTPPQPPAAVPLPSLPDAPSEADVSEALAAVPLADEAAMDAILGSDDVIAAYNKFRSWAMKVDGGAAAVVKSENARVSYTFGAESLLGGDPTVQITEMANTADGLTVSVVVKDGEDPVAVASEKVKAMFEATSDMGDWNKKLDLTVTDLTQTTADEVRFTVKPAGNSPTAFIRLKY